MTWTFSLNRPVSDRVSVFLDSSGGTGPFIEFERDYDSDGAVFTVREGTRHSDTFHGIEWEFRFGDTSEYEGRLLIPSHATRYTDFQGAACLEVGVFPFSEGSSQPAEHVWHITHSKRWHCR